MTKTEQLIAGRYRVERRLGEGGMASVWSVQDVAIGRRVALKRLTTAANPRTLTLFQREYHTLASLRHPSIVEAYEYGSDPSGPYYTMELLDGRAVAATAPLPWIEVCRILRDIASAVSLLHSRRLVHRDLSAQNVWLLPGGRIKLIDFGTLAAFGRSSELAGTPPYVAPEAFLGLDLDQRTDLYSLGALGYFLLTGRHAYPAKNFATLESIWRLGFLTVSQRIEEQKLGESMRVPASLDDLIAALLSKDPLARPTTAADLIERLSAIADLGPAEDVSALDHFLVRPAFIGRDEERGVLRRALESASQGKAHSVVVEGHSGVGRTRLLAEFALEAQIHGGAVIQAVPSADDETHDLALEFSLRLLAALPEAAWEASRPYARILAHLSPALRDRLGVAPDNLAEMPAAHGEARMRFQSALCAWFLDVAKHHLLVLVGDDLDAFDGGSAAWFAALSREASSHRLLIVAALRSERAPFDLPIQAFCQRAMRVRLTALSQPQLHDLFRSIWGDVPHLARSVDSIFRRTSGNPSHSLDIAEYLIRSGVIEYAAGEWILPTSIAEELIPATRGDADAARLARLSDADRRLAQTLSVRQGIIPLDVCAGLAEVEASVLFANLEMLVREGVLIGSADGYRFARDSLRMLLQSELDETRRKRAHLRLGSMLLAQPEFSELERLKAGVHLLVGGDDEEGSRQVAIAGRHYGLVELADLGPAAPYLEQALEHFRRAGRSSYELLSILPPLALAGYYADRKLAVRYGRDAIELLSRSVGLELAKSWRRFVGRKLSLYLSLLVAVIGFAAQRRNPRVPTFREAMLLLFYCSAALTGTNIICIDPKEARRYASVLEPMTALGSTHIATFMYEFSMSLLRTVSEHFGANRAQWIQLIQRLDRPASLRDLPSDVHTLFLAGALYASGVAESWRDDSRALQLADRLDSLDLRLNAMSADQIRMMYYANRGDLERFEHYRSRVEVHAIQRGTAWQVETWSYVGLVTPYLRLRDAAGLKVCVEQLRRLSAVVPSLEQSHQRALTAYLLTRGKPAEALAACAEEPPLELVGWTRAEGIRARALNELGRHAEARDVCEQTLALLSRDDLEFTAMNLGIRIELARAEAGLGNLEEAELQLRDLVGALEAPGNPLSLGELWEALAEVAARRGDEATLEECTQELGRYFQPTRSPALITRYEKLSQQLYPLRTSKSRESPPPPSVPTAALHLRGPSPSGPRSLLRRLRVLSRLASADEAYLFAARGSEFACVAKLGEHDHAAELATHVRSKFDEISVGDDAATCTEQSLPTPPRIIVGGREYQIVALFDSSGDHNLAGALVLPKATDIPYSMLRAMTEELRSSVSALDSPPPQTV